MLPDNPTVILQFVREVITGKGYFNCQKRLHGNTHGHSWSHGRESIKLSRNNNLNKNMCFTTITEEGD